MSTWRGEEAPPPVNITTMGGMRAFFRGTALGVVTFGCLGILLLGRVIERPLFGLHRPLTPYITQFVCRAAFRILGIGFSIKGVPIAGRGAVVANHSSWLDIFALNARKRIYFVSKAEVADWPGIGWLARATGTVFIRRDPTEAAKHTQMFEDRLWVGHRLLFFPEGTSTDGRRTLPFKSTLFAAFQADALRPFLRIQPVTVIYRAPKGEDARFYGWWGDMRFGGHLLKILAAPRQGSVEILCHTPLRADAYPNRKSLAIACETVVRQGLETGQVV